MGLFIPVLLKRKTKTEKGGEDFQSILGIEEDPIP